VTARERSDVLLLRAKSIRMPPDDNTQQRAAKCVSGGRRWGGDSRPLLETKTNGQAMSPAPRVPELGPGTCRAARQPVRSLRDAARAVPALPAHRPSRPACAQPARRWAC
jgi:hypothetical protein